MTRAGPALRRGMPIFVYHVPVATHIDATFDEMVELLDLDGVIGLKYAEWNL